MQRSYGEFRTRGAEIVGISMDNVVETATMAALTQARYKLLSDPDGTVTKAYGVYDLLGDGVAAPSVFIIGPNRKLEWSYVGKDVGDRPSAADILVHLEQRLAITRMTLKFFRTLTIT